MFAPAARLTDMHVCPMVNGVVPHVGGPILPVCHPTTLIAMLPAARVSDFALCVGPPDVIVSGSLTVFIGGKPAARLGDSCAHGGKIVMGCFTVLIGDSGPSGGGAGSGSGPGSSYSGQPSPAAAAHPFVESMMAAHTSGTPLVEPDCATQSTMSALAHSPVLREGDPNKKSYIALSLVDEMGKRVPYEMYRVVTPDGTVREGFLAEDGTARVDGIDPGTCKVSFPNRDKDAWSPV